MTIDEEIQWQEEQATAYKSMGNLLSMNMSTEKQFRAMEDYRLSDYHKQLAEWLKELKAYREDTRWADLYERICIKRDDDRDYFARTKDKTYITRIAEKEMFIHMMQDMMFDRYGVEEVKR